MTDMIPSFHEMSMIFHGNRLTLLEMDFKAWLFGLMEARGLTQEALGQQIGVRHATVGQWLRGKHPPAPGNLRGLAAFAGVDPIWLFRLVGYLPEHGQNAAPVWTPQVHEIAQLAERMNESDLLELVDIARLKAAKRERRNQTP